MDELLHHFETMGNHCFIGIYRMSVIPGFLRWCEMDFVTIHSIFSGALSCFWQNVALFQEPLTQDQAPFELATPDLY